MKVLDFLEKRGILSKDPFPDPIDIEAEFHSLPCYEVDFPPEHLRSLARHPDVWCYEHNRYKSPHDPDFWIDASVHPTGFIATMGPLDGRDFEGAADTRPHFWQMVHETGCRVIIMTTDLREGQLLKCSQYWPEKRERYGNLLVEQTKELCLERIHLRYLHVNDHPVLHMHLLNWKDHCAYPNLDDLDWIIDETKKERKEAPVIVHCSAGVGRTGTFICSYIIKEAAAAKLHVNIPKLVTLMRKEGRVKSVQEIEQYKMLYLLAKKYCANPRGVF